MRKSDKTTKSPTCQSILLEGASGSFVYELTYKKVKNINLRVVGGRVSVSAPPSVSIERISRFVLENEAFVVRALAAQKERLAEKQETLYADGGVFYYLGAPMRLSVVKGKRGVWLDGEGLTVSLLDTEKREAIREMLIEWISRETLAVTERICRERLPSFSPPLEDIPLLEVRAMSRRLGSCTPSRRRVTFTRTLACLPPECVEYVVLHELCHFIHADHSPAFYRELGAHLPSHRALKRYTSEKCDECFPHK